MQKFALTAEISPKVVGGLLFYVHPVEYKGVYKTYVERPKTNIMRLCGLLPVRRTGVLWFSVLRSDTEPKPVKTRQ